MRRELADNFCFYNENYDKIEGECTMTLAVEKNGLSSLSLDASVHSKAGGKYGWFPENAVIDSVDYTHNFAFVALMFQFCGLPLRV